MVKYNLIFSDLAYNDLEEIVLYISKDSKDNAIKFYNKLMDNLTKLEEFPNLGLLMPDKKMSEKGYRMIIVNNYIIFYKVYEKNIQILRVLHGSRDYPQLFKNL